MTRLRIDMVATEFLGVARQDEVLTLMFSCPFGGEEFQVNVITSVSAEQIVKALRAYPGGQ